MHKNNMNASWGFMWQQKDEWKHAVPANRGAASIELARRIQTNSCDCRLALLWQLTCTLRNCLFFTWAFITLSSSCTLGIGLWQKSDIVCYDLSQTSGVQDMRWVGACRSPIEPQSSDWQLDSISSSSLDGNRFTYSILRYGFWRPKHTCQSKCG